MLFDNEFILLNSKYPHNHECLFRMASAPQMKQAIETTSDDIIMGSSTESHQCEFDK